VSQSNHKLARSEDSKHEGFEGFSGLGLMVRGVQGSTLGMTSWREPVAWTRGAFWLSQSGHLWLFSTLERSPLASY